MSLLITKTDFATYNRVVSNSSLKDNRLNQFISDAQFVDVQKLLGMDLYNDLIRNSTDDNYQTLLNGGTYTYSGKTYTNVGLKSVIVYYAYARYVFQGSKVDTPFGLVEKTNQSSERVSRNDKKDLYKENVNIAFNYWENVKLFLDRNYSDYPLWNECKPVKRFRIRKIG